MSVWDDAEKELEQESLGSKAIGAVKHVGRDLSKAAGIGIGTVNAPLAALWGALTPYEDEYQEEEFMKESLGSRLMLRAGSALQSAIDSATKEGSFGKGYGAYYKAATGKQVNPAVEIAVDVLSDPLLIKGIGVGLTKSGIRNLPELSRYIKTGRTPIEQVVTPATKGQLSGRALAETDIERPAVRTIDEALAKKKETMSVWDEAEKSLKEETLETPTETPKTEVKMETPDSMRIEKEGKEIPHSTAKRIEIESITKELMDDQGVGSDIAKYTEDAGMLAREAETAVKLMDENFDDALKMVFGEKPLPEGLHHGSLLIAVANRATKMGDSNLLRRLATSKEAHKVGMEAGREVVAFRGLGDTVLGAIKDIRDTAVARIKKTFGKVPELDEAKATKLENDIKALDEELAKRLQTEDFSKGFKEGLDEAAKGEASDIGGMIAKIEQAVMEAGLRDRDLITQTIYDIVRKEFPDITLRDVMDAQSGYGKFKKLTPDELKIRKAQNHAEQIELAKLDDMEKGLRPKPTGRERVEKTKEWEELKRRVNAKMHKMGIYSLTKEQKDKVTVQLERIRKQIQKNEAIIAEKRFAVEIRGEKIHTKELDELYRKNEELKAKIREGRDMLDPNRQYKARLLKEEKKYNQLMQEGRFEKTTRPKKILDPVTSRIKAARDSAKANYDALMKAAGVPTKEQVDELIRLSNKKDELLKLRGEDGSWKLRDRLQYGAAKIDYDNYISRLKDGDMTLTEIAKRRLEEFKTTWREGGKEGGHDRSGAVGRLVADAFTNLSETSISLVASLDNSFIGRQGLTTLMTHPTIWVKAAKESFKDIYKALRTKHGNQTAKDILRADIVSRDRYLDGTYQKAGIIAKIEEQFPTSNPQRIPFLGRAFKASEVAFENSAMRMRVGLFDLLLDQAKSNGLKADDVLIQDIGKLVNSMTARASTKDKGFIKAVFWAPKMMAANINTLTAHGFGSGIGFGGRLETSFAREQAALNLTKMILTTAGVAAMINAMKPGSVELDPRSSDFLKVRIGNTRIDLTGGKGQYLIFFARFLAMLGGAEGSIKSAQTKILTKLNTGKFGDPTLMNVALDFLTNKTTPLIRTGIEVLGKGKTFEGKKPTVSAALGSTFTPIFLQNMYEDIFGDYPEPNKFVAVANWLDAFGVNANTYQPIQEYSEKDTIEMNELRDMIGKDKLKELEIIYNKTVNSKIDRIVKQQNYLNLPNEEKKKVIEEIRRETKQQVFKL